MMMTLTDVGDGGWRWTFIEHLLSNLKRARAFRGHFTWSLEQPFESGAITITPLDTEGTQVSNN